MRILLVEDEELVRMVLRRGLEEGGHFVTAVADVETARSVTSPIDAIVSDYHLPDGTAEDVQRAWPTTPILVISGYPPPVGYLGPWLLKPFPTTTLRRIVAKLVSA